MRPLRLRESEVLVLHLRCGDLNHPRANGRTYARARARGLSKDSIRLLRESSRSKKDSRGSSCDGVLMAKEFDNTNRGTLFNNRADKKTEKDRDYGGYLNVDGIDYWLSAWIKTSKKGDNFLSLSVKAKDAKTVEPRRTESTSPEVVYDHDFNDPLPF